ncbi:MAG: DUF2783 domain-containing protein [Kordiimonas sp.]
MKLSTDKSLFEDGDAFYAALIDKLDTYDERDAFRFLTNLTFILANEVAEKDKLEAAIDSADIALG